MNTIQNFDFHGQQVRTELDNGEPWFVAADVARILGYRMASDLTRRLDEEDKGTRPVRTPSGTQEMTVISEPGLFAAIIGSHVEGAKAFKRWVTHEVLPTIRRTGSFGPAAAPQTYAEALRELASSVEAKAALEAKVAADAPKVLFADSVATSDSTILVGDLAKILRGNGVEIGANRLFAQLREDGYLIRRQGTDWNMPTQRAMELGLFKVKETAVTHSDGHVTVSKTPKVTGKGQNYLINRYSPATKELSA
ncbi:phage antirepressor KilAC domain-containing protein [Arthrobacter sp. D3-18]